MAAHQTSLWRFEFELNTLWADGEVVEFSPMEAELFCILLDALGRLLGDNFIVPALWGRDEPKKPHGHIKVLKHILNKKLLHTGFHIESIWGAGILLTHRNVLLHGPPPPGLEDVRCPYCDGNLGERRKVRGAALADGVGG